MSWEELAVHQPIVVKILMNSIQKNRVTHAYVFEGGKGTGKRDIANEFAKSFFCDKKLGANPCMQCPDCKRIDSKNHPDLHFVSPDGQSIKKAQVEYLQKEFTYRGVESKRKFYIIEEADKMTTSAANSLLKFLEEPVSQTCAVLLTENTNHMLETILSRSQVLTFKQLSPKGKTNNYIAKGYTEPIAVILALLATNMEEAENLSANDWVVQARNQVIQLTNEIVSNPKQVLFTIQFKWLEIFQGKEQLDFGLDLLLLWYRDLLYTQIGEGNEVIYIDQKEKLEEQALHSSREKIIRQLSFIYEAKKQLHANVNPQLLMEKLVVNLQEG